MKQVAFLSRHPLSRILLACACLATAGTGWSQADIERSEHWAYASFFGTGWYSINEDQSVFVLKTTPRWKVGEAGFDDAGKRNVAWIYRVPMTFGLSHFDLDDVPGVIDPDNLSTATLAFGMDVDIPITRQFSIRPLAELGYGRVLGEPDSAWTYKAAVRSRYSFRHEMLDWALLAGLGYVGYTPDEGRSDDFTYAEIAAEFGYPVDWFGKTDSQAMFYWSLGYTEFIDEIDFSQGVPGVESIANYWQVGVAVGKRDTPVRIWFLNFDRLGVAYNYGNTGQLRGIRFVFRSLYEI
jgi:hypothetical protein